MALILQVFCSTFSGLLLALAIPSELYLHGLPAVAFFAITFYYLAISSARSYRQAFLDGFIQSVTTHLASSFWLGFFKNYAFFTLGASALATAFIGGFLAAFIFIPFSKKAPPGSHDLYAYSIRPGFYRNSAFRIFYFSSAYTAYEWVKSTGFIGYPWGTVSTAMFRFPVFMQLASITGTYGITFLTVCVNSLLAEGVIILEKMRHTDSRPGLAWSYTRALAVTAALFSCTMLYGLYEYNRTRIPEKTLSIIMVQQDANPWDSDSDADNIMNSEHLTQKELDRLRSEGSEAELVVWSEGVLTRAFPGAERHYKSNPDDRPLLEFVRDTGVPFLIGGSYTKTENDTRKYFNSALMFDKEGKFRGYYGKLHPVPFAEEIPGMGNRRIRKIVKKLVGISAGWSQGEQLVYFDVPCSYYGESVQRLVKDYSLALKAAEQKLADETPTVRISTPICFDDSFTDVIRPMFLNGAELFVNLTDDSWSLKKSSEYQHCIVASYRAIEYRTTLVRSTNSGWSVVMDPAGRVLCDMPLFEKASVSCNVPVYEHRLTVYARYGNWLPYTCLVLIFLTCAAFRKQILKQENSQQQNSAFLGQAQLFFLSRKIIKKNF